MELTEEMVKKAVDKVDIAMDSNAIEKDIATAVKVRGRGGVGRGAWGVGLGVDECVVNPRATIRPSAIPPTHPPTHPLTHRHATPVHTPGGVR